MLPLWSCFDTICKALYK